MRGRGHRKIEQDGVVKKVSEDHGSPVVRLPKRVLDLGVRLNQEIVIVVEKAGKNPLDWEIKIKPRSAETVPVPA